MWYSTLGDRPICGTLGDPSLKKPFPLQSISKCRFDERRPRVQWLLSVQSGRRQHKVGS